MHLGKRDRAARVPVFVLGSHREHPAHDLACSPSDGCNRRDSESLVNLGPSLVVDARNDPVDAVGLAGDPRGEDVRVVAAAHGGEGVGTLDAGGLEGLSIESDAGYGQPAEISGQPAELLGLHVDDRDGMAELV